MNSSPSKKLSDKTAQRVLLLIPSVIKRGIEKAVAHDQHPTMDYWALANALTKKGAQVELLDYGSVEGTKLPKDVALALAGFRKRNDFDAIFTNGENVALPLALLMGGTR